MGSHRGDTATLGTMSSSFVPSVLAQQEVSARDAVVGEAIGLRAGIRERLFSILLAVQVATFSLISAWCS